MAAARKVQQLNRHFSAFNLAMTNHNDIRGTFIAQNSWSFHSTGNLATFFDKIILVEFVFSRKKLV